MAFYYLKEGGTAGGTDDGRESATARSGSFATMGVANYYADLDDAFNNSTTPPVPGDFVFVSDAHALVTADSADVILGAVTTVGGPIKVLCVEDLNADVDSQGGSEEHTSVISELRTNAQIEYYGLTLDFDGSFTIDGPSASDVNANAGFNNCTIQTNNSITIRMADNSETCTIRGSDLIFTGAQASIEISTFANRFIMIGGSVSYTNVAQASGGVVDLDQGEAEFIGVDFNDANLDYLLESNSATSGNIHYSGCQLNSNLVDFINGVTPDNISYYILLTNCATSAEESEWQYYFDGYTGTLEAQDAIFRDQTTPFADSGDKVALRLDTNADCNRGNTFQFEVLSQFCKLQDSANDTIRIYFTSATTLTNADVYAIVSNPNVTNKNELDFDTNGPILTGADFTISLFNDGTTHTTDGVSTWTGALANVYVMDIPITNGLDSVPKVEIHVTLPSITIYFDTEFDTV